MVVADRSASVISTRRRLCAAYRPRAPEFPRDRELILLSILLWDLAPIPGLVALDELHGRLSGLCKSLQCTGMLSVGMSAPDPPAKARAPRWVIMHEQHHNSALVHRRAKDLSGMHERRALIPHRDCGMHQVEMLLAQQHYKKCSVSSSQARTNSVAERLHRPGC